MYFEANDNQLRFRFPKASKSEANMHTCDKGYVSIYDVPLSCPNAFGTVGCSLPSSGSMDDR